MDDRKRLHTLTFAVRPAEKPTEDGPLRFEGVAYSGGVVPAYGWHGDVVIDLAGLKNADGEELPVLVDHQASVEAIAGKGRIYRFRQPDGTQGLRIEGEVLSATDAGRQIAALLQADFPLQMSVGMNANFREITEPLVVNGREVRVSGVFEQPHIREVSFVPVGADPATSAAALRFAFDPVSQPSPAKEQATMSRTAEDEALIAGLQEQVKNLQAELERARTERRVESLSALFEEVGRDAPQGDAIKPYLEMSDAAFAAFAADLRAVAKRPQANPALFSSQALSRAASTVQDEPQDRLKALLAAVDRVSASAQTVNNI
ncbi:hypothetical protein [Tepidimonas sp. HKU79]|uniref:hypothetical protein n=1 Tax=Tepidimonas sp. HKU79 TaxID=3414505 RepID=UPI003C79A1E5